MKETRFFYAPECVLTDELPEDEASHAIRVLRLKPGDEMMLMDGCGTFYRAEVTFSSNHSCMYKIVETIRQNPQWAANLHIAIAPTKMMERMEWMAEKATEIGINEFSFLNCKFSERKVMKTARLERIVISAMKQSRKAWKPILHEMETFKSFIDKPRAGRKYIAHCYEEVPRKYLFDELRTFDNPEDCLVMIGPEGDFSIDEVKAAVDAGYISVHLGESRYRTETAAIAALMMMQLATESQH